MPAGSSSSPFTGDWDVTHATLPDGQFAYTGAIRMEEWGEAFRLLWDISAGRYVGIGLTHDDHLYVSCGEHFAGLGIALYLRRADGPPRVRWSTAALSGAIGSGVFTTPWTGSLEGEHQLLQYLPDGDLYADWTLSIRKVQSVYRLVWRKGDVTHYHGLGLETAGGLVAGWYPDVSQLAFLDYQVDPHDPERLNARWLLGGYTTLGSETLTRL